MNTTKTFGRLIAGLFRKTGIKKSSSEMEWPLSKAQAKGMTAPREISHLTGPSILRLWPKICWTCCRVALGVEL